MFPPLRDSPRDPTLIRMQMVPRKATISRFATNPTRAFLGNALKADRNHRVTFECPPGSNESVSAISIHDLQEFHFMTDKFHFMTYEIHFMTEPTHRDQLSRCFKYLAE